MMIPAVTRARGMTMSFRDGPPIYRRRRFLLSWGISQRVVDGERAADELSTFIILRHSREHYAHARGYVAAAGRAHAAGRFTPTARAARGHFIVARSCSFPARVAIGHRL